MSLRGDAMIYAVAVTAFILLPTKYAFLLTGIGGLIGGGILLQSQPKYAIVLIVAGAAFLTLAIRIVICQRRDAIRQAQIAQEEIQRHMRRR